ncbi:MAG: flagellar motor switch protein FliM [Geoalkalibacter sp.]|uniref:flagellar motor switch protein FliM n=1 Tax=Geoalkalibacter sp. TaxID=3041440 RepID=UPI002A99BFC7|nr:flagellar motor switch protein FliM [Thermodesulfobacteriota bacterium]
MERILSKEEIAELLAAVQDGEIETDPEGDEQPAKVAAAAQKSVSRLDLLRMQNSGRGRFQNIDILLDMFARNYGMSLTNRLQTSVSVKRADMETEEYESFLNKAPKNGLIGVIRMDPLKAGGLVLFDEQLSFSMLEMMLGGTTGGKFTIFDRMMTAIEINVVKGIIADTCPDLQKAFAPVEKLECSLVRVEVNPRMVSIVPPDAALHITTFSVTVDNLKGKMTLAIPHTTLDPLREKLKERTLGTPGRRETLWAQRIGEEVGETSVTVSAHLGDVELMVREILNFEVGDIIDLGCDPNSPLKIFVEDKHKFLALPGLQSSHKAVRIKGKV